MTPEEIAALSIEECRDRLDVMLQETEDLPVLYPAGKERDDA